jgi:hypothetical protein
MAAGNGLVIFLGIEHLDAASRTLVDRNGAGVHRVLPVSEAATGPVSDAMLRLAGPELGLDPDAVERAA